MSRESVELGFVLKQIKEYEFSMDTFDDRLRLQKMIYLLQACGVYLGYDFSWYLRGPYCSLLAHNGFDLQDVYDVIPDNIELKSREDRGRFDSFQKFIKGKSIDDLEIAASLHYLNKVRRTHETDKEILRKVTEKQDRFTAPQVEKIWKEMKERHLIL